METTLDPSTPAQVLRERMVDLVREAGHARTAPVEAAMRHVERHAFVPDAPVPDAYADIAVAIKTGPDGSVLSCASVPTIVAMMLDQLDVRPGQRILEIGAGTGYNAALLAHLTGPTGQVTTVDVDADVTTQARRNLDATGNTGVHVITRDGALGAQEHAPYDRIIVTVGAWDIPAGWWTQLGGDGRIVLPLRWRGQTRAIAMTRSDDGLEADSVELCGFVPMIGQDGEQSAPIDPDALVHLYWDADQDLDPSALAGILATSRTERWSEVTIGSGESFDGVWLHLSATEEATCRMATDQAAIAAHLATPAIPSRTPALASGSSLAYLTHRRLPDENGTRRWELGAIGHGPAAGDLTERICQQIRVWGHDREAEPRITAYRSTVGAPPWSAPNIIRKPDSTLVIDF